jgi:hypothetical protein
MWRDVAEGARRRVRRRVGGVCFGPVRILFGSLVGSLACRFVLGAGFRKNFTTEDGENQ